MKHLFLLPHQDDEVFVYPAIKAAQLKQDELFFCYLTTGNLKRDQESKNALLSWGIDEKNIWFLGTELKIPDSKLHLHLKEVLHAKRQTKS